MKQEQPCYCRRQTLWRKGRITLFQVGIKERIKRDVLPWFSARRQDNAKALMRHLHARPVVDVNMVAEIIGATGNTASALTTDMVSHGVLVEVTGQRRNRLFVFNE